jgi:alpha-galactosidase
MGGDWKSLMRNLDDNRHPDRRYVGPGKGWNYPDILLVGIPGGLNEIEEQTQFGMWAMAASPLFLGNDVFNMPQYAKDIVMNKEVIAIDQDPLGVQGDVVKEYENGRLQVWAKQLRNGAKAAALLNRDTAPREITVSWSDLGISGKWLVRDLWEHADKGNLPRSIYCPGSIAWDGGAEDFSSAQGLVREFLARLFCAGYRRFAVPHR